MKTLLLAFALLMTGLSQAHAQERFTCIETSNFSKTYVGHGDSRLEAKFRAIQACSSSENAILCQNEVECDSSTPDRWGRYQIVTCSETSNFSHVYIGRGTDRIDAKQKALRACQAQENAILCRNEVECDTAIVSPYQPARVFTCVETSNFSRPYLGKGYTRLEAKENARQACAEKENAIFCNNEVECE